MHASPLPRGACRRLFPAAACLPLLALALGSAGCSRTPPKVAGEKPPEVLYQLARTEWITDTEEFTGRLEASKKTEVQSRVTGYLHKINFVEGGRVTEGKDVLFEIEPSEYKAKLDYADALVEQAKVRLKRLELELIRAERLWNKRAIPEADYDVAVANHAEGKIAVLVAERSRDVVKVDHDRTKVMAPLTGLVSKSYLDEKNLITADKTVLTTVFRTDVMHGYFDVDERTQLKRLRELLKAGKIPAAGETGAHVRMALSDESGFPHEGTLDFEDVFSDPATGTKRLRGVFQNKHGLFTPGLFIRVQLQIGNKHEAVVVAEQGVGSDQAQKFVYVVNDKNEVEYRTVKTGALIAGKRVIEEGVKAGEKIIVSGLQRVRPKAKVEPKLDDSPAVAVVEAPKITIEEKKK